MTKNIKRMFFVLTLVTLLATVGAVSAADDANTTAAVDNSVSDVATVSDATGDTVAAEHTITTSNDETVDIKTETTEKTIKENKTINKKTQNNVKKNPITINGITYTNIIENKIFDDYEYDITENTYINNCDMLDSECELYVDANTYINNSNIYSIYIYKGNTYINNSNITYTICTYGPASSYIYNSNLNNRLGLRNNGYTYIDDETTIGNKFNIYANEGTIESTNPYIAQYYTQNGIYISESEIINTNIQTNITITKTGVLTIKNSTINSSIHNDGILIIDDNTDIEDNFTYSGNGELLTNNTKIISKLNEMGVYLANQTINNQIINKELIITKNITFINSQINALITNNANITFINCSFSNNNMNKSSLSPSTSYLLDNKGTARLENCIIENNTFNYTGSDNYDRVNGAIVNNGTMTVVNTVARNNSLGYYWLDDYNPNLKYGRTVGKGTVLSNYGTLTIDNSTFNNNIAGESGAAIYNNGTLNITSSSFEDNLAYTRGGAIYTTNNNNIKTQIVNTVFKNNKVDLPVNIVEICGGGAIYAKDFNGNITNCTFENNLAVTNITGLAGVKANGGSIALEGSYGLNISVDIKDSQFINHECEVISNGKAYYQGQKGTIINSTFENNKGGIVDYNNLTINNNTFKNISNSEYIISNIIHQYPVEKNISNNLFINNNITSESIYITNSYANQPYNITVTNNTYSNTTINDTLDLVIPSKIYTGEPITITGTYAINNPDNYDADILDQNKFNIYINGVLDQTVDTLDFTVTPTAGSMMVTVQPTISQTRKTHAIRATTLTDITITPENYNEYIYEGVLVGVSKDTRVKFSGEFTDKGDIVFDTNNLIIDGTNATFTNTTFTLDNENITLQNMNINNNEVQYTITNAFNNNIIANNTITVTNTQTTGAAIYNTASNTLIENNTITQTAPAYDIDFSTGQGVASTQAILLLGGDKNTVQNNNINIKATSTSTYGTLEAITNNNGATNTIITQNTINISGANFNYAIDSLNNVENITITENTITVTGERYCDGIQAGNSANNILIDNNNITCICINTTELTTEGAITYGVIATSMGSYESENITITNNNIDITGTANYGIELYKVNKTEIHNNTITVNGPFSMGIGYAYSPNGNATQNTIITNGDSTTPINQITEEFQPENVGIRIQNGTTNVSITENTITTSDVGGHDSTIHTEPDNVTITNNQLTSSQGYGDETIIAPETATIENNIVETTTTLAVPETIIINTPVELTATVTTADGTPINGGTVTFTIGNEAIAQETVTDGIATATHTFTQEEDDVTIVASYTPESTGLSTSSDEETTTIEIPLTQLNIEEIDLTAGETVTLTATVTDQNGNNINGGKVTFKVNGKTIKDASGKVIYAKVVDGVATAQYTVPENLGGQDITVTAVYSGTSKYNKETTTITTTVTAPEAKLTITPITSDVQTGSTITLKAKVAAGDKAITTGKILFKINGKTVKDTNGKVIYAKVDANGEASVNYTLPESFKAGTYNIEAVFTAPGYEKLTDNTTMTVVKS